MPTDPGGNSGASAKAAPKKAAPKKAPTVYKPMYANDARNSQVAEIHAQAKAAMPAGYQDPYNGVDPLTALMTGLQHGVGGGGGGSSRGHSGGGGSAASGPTPAQVAAQQAILDQMLASQNQGYDARQASLQGIQAAQGTRMSGILGELGQDAGRARTDTAASYAHGDTNLQNLMSQYSAIAAQRQAQGNQLLGAFGQVASGAQGAIAPQGEGVTDMLMAARAANTMRGNAADQMYADRANVYSGLGADANMQNGQTLDALLAKLAQERQTNSSNVALQRAQVGIQGVK